MTTIEKYYREDGKVGILVSASENLQWYTDNFEYTQEKDELLYCSPLVKVLSQKSYTQQDIAKALIEFGCKVELGGTQIKLEEWLEGSYTIGSSRMYFDDADLYISYKNIVDLEVPKLKVCWLEPNTKFQVIFDSEDDYDRENEILREILVVADTGVWLTA